MHFIETCPESGFCRHHGLIISEKVELLGILKAARLGATKAFFWILASDPSRNAPLGFTGAASFTLLST